MNERLPAADRRSSRRKLALFAGIPALLAVTLVVVLVSTGGAFRKPRADASGDHAIAEGSSAPEAGGVPSSGAPSGTPTSAPASKAAPSRSAVPAPDPGSARGGGRGCGLPRYPKPSCTGVPAGVKLTTLALNVDNDSYAVKTPGAVIDRRHIPGNLLIRADNVTIRNSQIDGTVYNDEDATQHPYTIEDSTVGLASKCITAPGLTAAKYTARRVKVLGHDDGFRVDTPGHVRIYDSYAKLCWNPPSLAPPDGSHSGGIQA